MLARTRVLAEGARFTGLPHEHEDDGVDHHDNRAEGVTQDVQENATHVELGGSVVSVLQLIIRSAAVNLQIQAVTVTHI